MPRGRKNKTILRTEGGRASGRSWLSRFSEYQNNLNDYRENERNRIMMFIEEATFQETPIPSFNRGTITLEKYINEIRLQIQEYIERNQSNPSYLKINKRAQQLLMHCASMYQVRDYRTSRESTFMGLKICPTDDIDLEQIEVF